MLSLDDLGGISCGGGGSPRRIVCGTADAAVRMLTQLAEEGNSVLPHHRARVLAAVVGWILDDQQDQAETREGMARMMLDAARAAGRGRLSNTRRGPSINQRVTSTRASQIIGQLSAAFFAESMR